MKQWLLFFIYLSFLSFSFSESSIEEDLESLLFAEVPTVFLATRSEERINEAPAIITVITQKELRQMGALTYLDALKRIPGIEISMARFGQYEILIRGIKTTGTEKVKVFIDGHSINESFFGSAMTLYDDLSINNIKQIEIIRGPGSALYGANAFSGVINIITLKAKDLEKQSLIFDVGSYDTGSVGFLFGHSTDDYDLSGYFEYLESDGLKETVTQDLQSVFDLLTGSNASLTPGDTYFPREKFDFNLNFSMGNWDLNAKYTQRERGDYIGLVFTLTDETVMDLEQGFVNLKYNQTISNFWQITYNIFYDYFREDIMFQIFPRGYTNFLGDTFDEGYFTNLGVTNQKYGFELQNSYQVNDANHLLFGFLYEYLDQSDVTLATNANPFTDAYLGGIRDVTDTFNWNRNVVRKIWALYLQDRHKISETLDLTLGIRHDDYDDFGGTTNPKAGLVWKIHSSTSIKFLFGTAFRAPNFRELYDQDNANTIGNTDLDPETIQTFEMGVDSQIGTSLILRTALFYNEIEDIIIEGPRPSPTEPSPFINVNGETIVKGVELEAKYFLNEERTKSIYTNYSHQHSEGTNDNELPDIPEYYGNLGFNCQIGEYLHWNTNMFYSAKRPRAQGDSRDAINSYSITNTSLLLRNLSERFEIGITIMNIFDEDVVEPGPALIPDDYPQQGRTYWGKITLLF